MSCLVAQPPQGAQIGYVHRVKIFNLNSDEWDGRGTARAGAPRARLSGNASAVS